MRITIHLRLWSNVTLDELLARIYQKIFQPSSTNRTVFLPPNGKITCHIWHMLNVRKLPYFRHEIVSPARIIDWTINGAIVYRCYSVSQSIETLKINWNINFTREVMYLLCKIHKHNYFQNSTVSTQLHRWNHCSNWLWPFQYLMIRYNIDIW